MFVGVLIFYSVELANFIPIIHNLILIIGILVALSGLVLLNYKIYKIKSDKLIKWVVFFVGLILSIYIIFVSYIAFVFVAKPGRKFVYNNKSYYISNEGFMDPYAVVYEKNGLLTMKQVQEYTIYFSEDVNKISEEVKEKLVKGTYQE